MIEEARFSAGITGVFIALLRQSAPFPAATLPLPVVARCRRSAPMIRALDDPDNLHRRERQ